MVRPELTKGAMTAVSVAVISGWFSLGPGTKAR